MNIEWTEAIEANVRYFRNPLWLKSYFDHVHRDAGFRERWIAAAGVLDDRIVVDVGCGPGNVFATLGGRPRRLIGIDVASEALEHARQLGYDPLLADAQNMPLSSGIADLVIVNASLHHCNDMSAALKEAARLVAPGGLLVTDHDPQLSAWNFKGPGKWLWDLRLRLYHWAKIGFHASLEEQSVALASEIHHRPGDGVTRHFFESTLRPLGFDVEIFPHNHRLGANVLHGGWGKADFKYRLGQRLSSIEPDAPEAALSLMCRARRRLPGESPLDRQDVEAVI
ncbi:class I SAM-dependent methyltransferase [Methylocella silvestris]|uniref:class I SAM-dependent methyltransferase n=1 Tax=Methylocella silvestris TaxID=199596 RepID=UPI001FE1FE54